MQGGMNFTLHTRQSWWQAHSRPKHVEKRNKHTKKNCAPSWLYLQECFLDIYPYLSLANDISSCNDKIITGIILNIVTVPPSKIIIKKNTAHNYRKNEFLKKVRYGKPWNWTLHTFPSLIACSNTTVIRDLWQVFYRHDTSIQLTKHSRGKFNSFGRHTASWRYSQCIIKLSPMFH